MGLCSLQRLRIMDRRCCPLCGSTQIILDEFSGELVCYRCGLVLGKSIHRGPEWRAYGYGDRLRRERAGAPITPLLHDLGLSTDHRIRDGDEELRIRVLSEIHRLSSSMNLPRSVAETAGMLLRKLGEDLRNFNRSIEGLSAALLYLSLRIHEIPRDVRELAEYSGVDQNRILRLYVRLAQILGVRPRFSASSFISKLVKSLGLPARVEEYAGRLCSTAIRQGLSQGRSLRALAAASVYLAAKILGYPVSQRVVSRSGRVSLSSIRRRLKELKQLASAINI